MYTKGLRQSLNFFFEICFYVKNSLRFSILLPSIVIIFKIYAPGLCVMLIMWLWLFPGISLPLEVHTLVEWFWACFLSPSCSRTGRFNNNKIVLVNHFLNHGCSSFLLLLPSNFSSRSSDTILPFFSLFLFFFKMRFQKEVFKSFSNS